MKFDWRLMLVVGVCASLSACGGGPAAPAAKVTEPAKDAAKPDSGTAPDKPAPTATQAAAGESQSISLKYVTDDVIAAAVIRPKQIWESQFMQAAVKAASAEVIEREIQRMKDGLGLDPRTLTEIQVLADAGMLQGEASQRPTKSADEFKLQQIGLAFHNYHDVYLKFPAVDGPGAKLPGIKSGLSWRVYLLPFLDNAELYDEFHLNEPWDSEHNKKLIEKMPDIYETAVAAEKGKTAIQVFTGEGTPFRPGQPSGIADFVDGTSNTLLAVIAGADQADIWTKPGGLPFDADDPWKAVGKLTGNEMPALFADGSLHRLSRSMPAETLANAIQLADGKVPERPEAIESGDPILNALLVDLDPQRSPTLVIRNEAPLDDTLRKRLESAAESKTHADQPYFAYREVGFAFPDQQTVMIGRESQIKKRLEGAAPATPHPVRDLLAKARAREDIIVAANVGSQSQMLEGLALLNPQLGDLAKLKTVIAQICISCKPGDTLVSVAGEAVDEPTAEKFQQMLKGVLMQGQGLVALLKDQPDFPKGAEDALKGIQIARSSSQITISARMPAGLTDEVPGIIASAVMQAQAAAKRTELKNNLKQIGLAMHNFHDTYNAFPRADGPAGPEPKNKGLSWRVYLLPYIDQGALYNQFHLDEPWDSPDNKRLIEKMPDIFKSPGVDEPGKTAVHVFAGEGAPFAGGRAPGLRDFTDGSSQTILVIQAAPNQAEIWTKPGGLPFDPADPRLAIEALEADEFLILMGDGSVHTVRKTINPATFRRLVQCADGEDVGEF